MAEMEGATDEARHGTRHLKKVCCASMKSTNEVACWIRYWAALRWPNVLYGRQWLVPMDPVPNELPGVLAGLEGVLPCTLFLGNPKESLNDAVLLGHGGRSEFVPQWRILTDLTTSMTLKEKLRRTVDRSYRELPG